MACLVLGVWLPIRAQVDYGPLSGHVVDDAVTQDVVQRRSPMVGAVVTVISPRDTLHTTTNYQGLFYLKRVPAGYVRVEVSFLGYETYKRDSVRIAPRFGAQQPLRVRLKPQSQEIDQVVVEGRARLVSQRGDTLVYNAAAVRTMDGDETIRMLERLPGVAAYDLLNRGSNFTTTTYADYEMQRWQPSYGRYFTLNVGIRLNKASQREFGQSMRAR